MNNPAPLWSYVVITIGGVLLFIAAIVFLVETIRTTGSKQYYYAFYTVSLIAIVALLLSIFAVERK